MDDGRFRMATRRLSDALEEEQAKQERIERRHARDMRQLRVALIVGLVALLVVLCAMTPWAQAHREDEQRVLETELAGVPALPGAELAHRVVKNKFLRPLVVSETYIQEITCSEVQLHYQQAAASARWTLTREQTSTTWGKYTQGYQLSLDVDCTILEGPSVEYGASLTSSSLF